MHSEVLSAEQLSQKTTKTGLLYLICGLFSTVPNQLQLANRYALAAVRTKNDSQLLYSRREAKYVCIIPWGPRSCSIFACAVGMLLNAVLMQSSMTLGFLTGRDL